MLTLRLTWKLFKNAFRTQRKRMILTVMAITWGTISIVLLVQHTTGSYGAAGAAAAVTGVSMAVFAPYSGRLADRYGQRAVLIPGILVHHHGTKCAQRQ